ncbi:MAG: DNA-3-methyladenine glycosylase [Planctomycetia bacterium]|nr:DNA-3-methyladenine glycosylase [Planctomycetia bacterium]
MAFFEYGQAEMDYLGGRDKKMGELINRIGLIRRALYPNIFTGLVHTILAQQISPKAAQTIYDRLVERVGHLDPETVVRFTPEQLAGIGLSGRKTEYILSLAQTVCSGGLDDSLFPSMSDEEIVQQLVKLKGVGVWSAEMILIFGLGRKDVFSPGDYGMRRGLMKLYRKEEITPEQFKRYRKKFSPYGTIASFYLWECNQE